MAHLSVMSTVSVFGDQPMSATVSQKHGDMVSIIFGHSNDHHLILDFDAFERFRALLATIAVPAKETA